MTVICVFFLLLLYVELLVYWYSAQTLLFLLPETIEVFGRGGESRTEGFV